MRDPNRIGPILRMLEVYWRANPDLRLCQLLTNLADSGSVFYVEDTKILEALQRELSSGK